MENDALWNRWRSRLIRFDVPPERMHAPIQPAARPTQLWDPQFEYSDILKPPLVKNPVTVILFKPVRLGAKSRRVSNGVVLYK